MVDAVAADALEEADPKGLSNFKAWEESTPPKASSNEIPAEDWRGGRVGPCEPAGTGWDDPEEKASSKENGFVLSTGGKVGAPLFFGTPKAASRPVGFFVKDGEEGAFPFPFTLGGGGKPGDCWLADAKSKLSSKADSKEKLPAGDASAVLGIFPMAASKASTPAICGAGAEDSATGKGFDDFVNGAPKTSTDAGSAVSDLAILSVGAAEAGLGVWTDADSDPEAASPKASSNEVDGTSIPLGGTAFAGVLSVDACSLCFTLERGSSSLSLSLSESSTSISLRGAPRSVSPC